MVVSMTSDGETIALNSVADEDCWGRVLAGLFQSLCNHSHVVPPQVFESALKLFVAELLNQPPHFRSLGSNHFAPFQDVLAKGSTPLIAKCAIRLVIDLVKPPPQNEAPWLPERSLHPAAVFDHDDVEPSGTEGFLNELPAVAFVELVQALPIVVDEPPVVPKAVSPSLHQTLKDVPFIELGIAHQSNKAGIVLWRSGSRCTARHWERSKIFANQKVLGKRRKGRCRCTETHAACAEVHIRRVLGAAGIGLDSTQ
mmetsp:Transcript_184/g.592  ORF Transcript_184/g.592 Transcript_184/m.592 type:complete len:255 (-) Transcript_184:551-1315(-)